MREAAVARVIYVQCIYCYNLSTTSAQDPHGSVPITLSSTFSQFGPKNPVIFHCFNCEALKGPKTSRSSGRWPSGSDFMYVMEKRYWNARVSTGAAGAGAAVGVSGLRIMREMASRERAYTSSLLMAVRSETAEES